MLKKLSNIVLHYDQFLDFVSEFKTLNYKIKAHDEYIFQKDLGEFWDQHDLDEVLELILMELNETPKLFGYFDYTIEELTKIKGSLFIDFKINQEIFINLIQKNSVLFADNNLHTIFKIGDYVTMGNGRCGYITDIYSEDLEVEVDYENGPVEPYVGVWETNHWKLMNTRQNRLNNDY